MKQTYKKPGALPVYIQISELIARRINAGQLLAGERLPTERDMAREFSIAVGTLRKALRALQMQGLITRKHGSGNYINTSPEATNVYSLFRLESLGGVGLPTAQLISLRRQKKPQNIPICNLIANHAPLFSAGIYSFLSDIDEEKLEMALNYKYDALYIWGLYIKIRCKK